MRRMRLWKAGACALSALLLCLVPAVYAQQPPATPPAGTPATPASPSTPPAPGVPPAAKPLPAPAPAPPTAPAVPHAAQTDYLSERMNLGDGREQWHPTRRQIGISYATGVSAATPAPLLRFTVDSQQLTAYLKKLAPYVRRVPIDARPVVLAKYAKNEVSDRSDATAAPIKILPSREGAVLDVDKAVAAITQSIAADPRQVHIVLPLKTTQPRVTGADLAGIDARIGHFVTHFNPHETGRTQTVRLAIDLIDGAIVAPGKTFSVNTAVGERTAKRGFGMGIVFIEGHLDKQLGGGMCQVATTLFNAALLANMKIVLRYQHERTVPYVDPGDDATVYWGHKDFRFQNSSQTPLFISYKTTATHAICDLYGKAEPDVKVSVVDRYRRLGPRQYTAVLRRYVTKDGKTVNDYTAYSSYKWTPALDYNF